jgi:hypothetical protein
MLRALGLAGPLGLISLEQKHYNVTFGFCQEVVDSYSDRCSFGPADRAPSGPGLGLKGRGPQGG